MSRMNNKSSRSSKSSMSRMNNKSSRSSKSSLRRRNNKSSRSSKGRGPENIVFFSNPKFLNNNCSLKQVDIFLGKLRVVVEGGMIKLAEVASVVVA